MEGNRPQAQWLVTCLCRSGEGQVREIANLATAPGILLVLDGGLRPLLTSTPQSEQGPPLGKGMYRFAPRPLPSQDCAAREKGKGVDPMGFADTREVAESAW